MSTVYISKSIMIPCRYVLDGFPTTKAQVELLVKFKVVPVCIVELNVSNKELLQRATRDRTSTER